MIALKQKAFLSVVFAAIIAATGAVFIKFMTLSPGSIGWLRATVPTLGFALILKIQQYKLFERKYLRLIPLSIFSSLRLFFFIAAFVYTTLANAVVIFYSYPIFTILLSGYLIKEKINRKQILLILVAFVGIVIIYANKEFSFGSRDFLGMGAALIAAILFSYIVILMKKYTREFIRNEILYVQNFSGTLLFLPFFLLEWQEWNVLNISYGILYGFFIGLGTYSLLLLGLKHLKASIASGLMILEVPMTILFGILFFQESISINIIVGAILIILSSLMLRTE